MARIDTYQQREIKTPTPTRGPVGLGGTTKLQGRDYMADAMQTVGGAMQDVGKVVKAYDDARTELKNDADQSNYSVAYNEFVSGTQAELQKAYAEGQIQLKQVAPEFNKRVSEWNSKWISDSDYNDDVKRWAEQSFTESHSQSMIKMNGWTRGRETERYIVNLERGMGAAISGKNMELAETIKEKLGRYTTPEKAQASFDQMVTAKTTNDLYAGIAANPKVAMDDIDNGVYNLPPKELEVARGAAESKYNKQRSMAGNALIARVYGLQYGNPITEGDTLEQVKRDADMLWDAKMLDPTNYDSVNNKIENIYKDKEKEPMAASEIADLITRISVYNPDEDPSNTKFAQLVEEVNAIEESRDFNQANEALEIAENGGVRSVHWKNINSVIDNDMKATMMGMVEAVIKPETGLLAKREVAQFLRENPTDAEGALKLYDSIKANDASQHTKNYYRSVYQYGAQRSPTSAPARGAMGLGEPTMRFGSVEAAENANLPKGTIVIINGRTARID